MWLPIGEILDALLWGGRKFYGHIVRRKDCKNAVLLVGVGGSGKTSLVSKIFWPSGADPSRRTEAWDLYITLKDGNKIKPKTWLFINDYKGQEFASAIRGLLEEQKKNDSPLRYGGIRSLVLVVDLVAPDKHAGGTSGNGLPDNDRIKYQLQQWSDVALGAVWGFLTSSLRYVCLYINKVDLMKRDPTNLSLDQSYIDVYQPLIEQLKRRVQQNPNVKFEVILGSAPPEMRRGDEVISQGGEGIGQLTQSLVEISWKK